MMKFDSRFALKLSVVLTVAALILPLTATAQNTVTFLRTDEPGRWFKNVAGPIAGTQSLAIATPGVVVTFEDINTSNAVHTLTSLLFPAGAANMPFDSGTIGDDVVNVTLTTPGLYDINFRNLFRLQRFFMASMRRPRLVGLSQA